MGATMLELNAAHNAAYASWSRRDALDHCRLIDRRHYAITYVMCLRLVGLVMEVHRHEWVCHWVAIRHLGMG